VIISSGVLVPAEIARLVGSWRAEQEPQVNANACRR
jgi:hypothetical protein